MGRQKGVKMIDVWSNDCNRFIAGAIGCDLLTVEVVMDVEYQYLYGLGLIDGPEPAWTVMEPAEFSGGATSLASGQFGGMSHRHYVASRTEQVLGISDSLVLAILEAEVAYLMLQGVVNQFDVA